MLALGTAGAVIAFSAAEEQGVGGQQQFGDDQQHNVPFDAQAAAGLHQAE